MHLEFCNHCQILNFKTVPQLGQDVSKNTEKPLTGCRVGVNRENAPGEVDKGWWFLASETKVVVKRYRIRALGLLEDSSVLTNRHYKIPYLSLCNNLGYITHRPEICK
jgi:hypothetical protein